MSPSKASDLNPGISVIIPAFNAERSIARCVESVLASSVTPDQMEVICIDNGSTDGTAVILRKYLPLIELLVEAKRGPAAARNAGLRAATREFTAFTDADCFVDPSWLTNIVAPLRAGAAEAVGGRILARPGAGSIERFGELVHDHERAIEIERPPYAVTMNFAARTDLLRSIGMFDERWIRLEDVDLSYRLLAAGNRIIYESNAIAYHHNRDTLLALIREGFLHGYYRPKFLRAHRKFIDEFIRNSERVSLDRLPSRRSESTPLEPWQISMYWAIFKLGKRAGEIAGRVF
jgi:glycosyltransferase involved in cell wall biosynthesis